MPCDVLHGRIVGVESLNGSCTVNAAYRWVIAFLDSVALYLPVHVLPTLLTHPSHLLQPRRTLSILLNALRSAAFLSTFTASYWYTVCLTRSLILARLFPSISHDFWDGPFGAIMVGSLTCGSSIWIENGRRRGEMALYVLPRAIRACIPETWLRRPNRVVRFAERVVFVLSLSYLLSTAIHRPGSLRGLSHWTFAFITNGPNFKFWRQNPPKLESQQNGTLPENADSPTRLISKP